MGIISLTPDLLYSTHYSYILENITLERIWDFDEYAAAILIKPVELDDDDAATAVTAKYPIKHPVDKDGNTVDPKCTIDNVVASDILLKKFIVI